MTDLRIAGLFGVGIAALFFVAGCEVESGSGPVYRPEPPQARSCPRIYDPVCAARDGTRRTFPNSCEADAADYRVVRGGQCDRNIGPPGQSGRPGRPGRPDRPDRPGAPGGSGGGQSGGFCPQIYSPVCASRGGATRTFPNACQAGNAGYRVRYESECRPGAGTNNAGGREDRQSRPIRRDDDRRSGHDTRENLSGRNENNTRDGRRRAADDGDRSSAGSSIPTSSEGGACSRVYVPVCGTKAGKKQTFVNACMAQAEDYTVSGQGRCDRPADDSSQES